MISDLARAVFAHLCHQEAGRAWVLGGYVLPLCARCTGVYAGAALAAATLPLARFEPSRRLLWLHGAAMLQMLFLGLGFFDEPPGLRTLSGSIFAVGALYFLWLPARRLLWPKGKGSPLAHLAGAGGAIVCLQVLVRIDFAWAATVVESLSLLGVAALALLCLSVPAALLARPAMRREAS